LLDTEDNDDQGTASVLAALGCDAGSATVQASLEPSDGDWFAFDSPWTCGDPPNPSVEASVDIAATLCAYVDCTSLAKTPSVSCIVGAASNAPGGQPGCCGGASVDLYVNCSGGGNESLAVWMSVDTGPEVCTDYELTYEVIAE
jgi:hypothetical protein